MINRKEKQKILLFDKANLSEIKTGLINFIDVNNINDMNVQKLWDKFKVCLNTLVEKYIPTKTVSGKQHLPWLNSDIKKLMKKRDRTYSKMKKTKNYTLLPKIKKIRSFIQKKIRTTYWDYMNNIICDETEHKHGTTKRFWGFIKSLKNDSGGVAPLRDDGVLNSSPKDKAEVLNKHFSSVFTNVTNSSYPDLGNSPYKNMPSIYITVNGVKKLLLKLNPYKAAGPDQIKHKILRECANEIAPIFTILFNKSLISGSVPSDWSMAFVAPIFKKGEKYQASNYRPVSLTCIACKLLEHIVVSNILDHLDNFNILVDNQHGFRARRSCETQLVGFIHDLASTMQRDQMDVAIMDFSKAFDSAPDNMRKGVKTN